MVIAQQMATFFILMLLGIVLRKMQIITYDSHRQLTKMVVYFLSPALIISGADAHMTKLPLDLLLFSGAMLLATQIWMCVSGWLLAVMLRANQDESPVYQNMCICPNVMFVALPLAMVVYGSGAMLYMSIFVVISNITFFSYGVWLLAKGNNEAKFNILKALFNPCLLASLVLLILVSYELKMPSVVSSTIQMLANCAPGICMLLLGSAMFEVDRSKLLHDMKLIIFSLFKMIIVPVITIWFFKLFTDDIYLLAIIFVNIASPGGVMVVMLSTLYRPKALPVASRGVPLTTAMSVLTIPLVALLCNL